MQNIGELTADDPYALQQNVATKENELQEAWSYKGKFTNIFSVR